MNSVLSWIILLLLWLHGCLGTFSCVIDFFLVYSYSLTCKGIVLLFSLVIIETRLSVKLCWLYIVEWRCEIDINICLDNADSIILIFGLDFQDVDFKLFPKNFDCDGIFLMQTCEISQLVLQNCFWIV